MHEKPQGAESIKIVQDIPNSWDWNATRPDCMVVRDQGDCGSCWAFAAVGSLGDNRCISGKDAKRIIYSEQYLISCDSRDFACYGGILFQDEPFLENTGVPTNECDSYKSGTDGLRHACPITCDDGSAISRTKSTGYSNVCADEQTIMAALQNGTIKTYFNVYDDFYYYQSGIYQHQTGKFEGVHTVVIIGYGEDNGEKYWKVRNSWGVDWGMGGYFEIVRGVNECGFEEYCVLVDP